MNKSERALSLDGAKCRAARIKRGFSRERLAQDSRGGLSEATIKRIEAGASVYLDTARRFAELVGLSIAELTPSQQEPPAEGVPAIAILPFRMLQVDDDGRYFADGLVEDLITRLGKRWFPVISRGSTFRYEAEGADPQRIRAELGASYVLEGTVRRSADKLRVTARLTDTETARQLWSSSYDRAFGEVFALQDNLVSTIIGQADGAMLDEEYRGLVDKQPADLAAWELSLRGSWLFHRKTKDGNAEAQAYFERALKKDRRLPLAWYFLALTHHRAILHQWSPDPGGALREMKRVCTDFAAICPNDPWMHVALAFCAVISGAREEAISRLREAIALDPNATVAYSLYGQTLAMAGNPDEAITQFEEAMRLSPRDTELWTVQTAMALCHFVAERYEPMLHWAKLAVQTRADMPFPYGTIAVAHVYLGNVDEARSAAATMLSLEPATSLRGVEAIVRSTNPLIAERYIAGLSRAGIPS